MSKCTFDESETHPGWDAIDFALRAIYGGQEPRHFAPPVPAAFGGSDPLNGISAYQHLDPIPHWHLVTYGFSELFQKETDDPKVSGFGFELTLRVRTPNFDDDPPAWTINFLQNFARYVFSSGNPFAIGHHMNLNGPIALCADTKLRAIAFARDPELGKIETPNGCVDFLQVIGISLDELLAAKTWDTTRLLETLLPRLPLWITDLDRAAFTDDPEIAGQLKVGGQRDGSSTGIIFVGVANWELHGDDQLIVVLGANGVRDFKAVLPGRLPHQQTLTVASKEGNIIFVPAGECGWQLEENRGLSLRVSPAAADEIANLVVARAGDYSIPSFPKLLMRVVKSEIKDSKGNVVEIIG